MSSTPDTEYSPNFSKKDPLLNAINKAIENIPDYDSPASVQMTAVELIAEMEHAATRGAVEGGIILDTLHMLDPNKVSIKKQVYRSLRQIGIEKERCKIIIKAYCLLNAHNDEENDMNENNTEVLKTTTSNNIDMVTIENNAFDMWVKDLNLVFDPTKSMQTTFIRRTQVDELISDILQILHEKKSTVLNAEIALIGVMTAIKDEVKQTLKDTKSESTDLKNVNPDSLILYQRTLHSSNDDIK